MQGISTSAPRRASLAGFVAAVVRLLARIPDDAIAILARLSMAAVFWLSGQTKVNGWHVTESAIYLFQHEYNLPLINPTLAAYMAAAAEHLFPVLLVLGLASRFAALGLLVMTLVIQTFVYPDAWVVHASWAACLLFIVARGPGRLSLDYLIARQARPA
jgi:putative oxidoreductase